jgi:hypothetical protein
MSGNKAKTLATEWKRERRGAKSSRANCRQRPKIHSLSEECEVTYSAVALSWSEMLTSMPLRRRTLMQGMLLKLRKGKTNHETQRKQSAPVAPHTLLASDFAVAQSFLLTALPCATTTSVDFAG